MGFKNFFDLDKFLTLKRTELNAINVKINIAQHIQFYRIDNCFKNQNPPLLSHWLLSAYDVTQFMIFLIFSNCYPIGNFHTLIVIRDCHSLEFCSHKIVDLCPLGFDNIYGRNFTAVNIWLSSSAATSWDRIKFSKKTL